MTPLDLEKIRTAVNDHEEGFALDRMFYTSQSIYQLDELFRVVREKIGHNADRYLFSSNQLA